MTKPRSHAPFLRFPWRRLALHPNFQALLDKERGWVIRENLWQRLRIVSFSKLRSRNPWFESGVLSKLRGKVNKLL